VEVRSYLVGNLINFIIDGTEDFIKNGVSSFISVCTVSFSLFLLGLFLLVSMNIKAGIEGLEKAVPIFVFFSENSSSEGIRQIKRKIEQETIVSHVKYVSPKQALKQFIRDIKGSLVDIVEGDNPFPPFLEVYPKKEYLLKKQAIKKLKKKLQENSLIENVEYDDEWGIRVEALVKVWDYLIYFLGLSFFVTTAFIISNTVDISIQSQELEMNIIRWAGGSNWVMGGPFLFEGIIEGALGGIFSLALLYGAFYGFVNSSSGLVKALLPASSSLVFLSPLIMLKIILVAVSIGALGSIIAIVRTINIRKYERCI